jgi:hypothetical protein
MGPQIARIVLAQLAHCVLSCLDPRLVLEYFRGITLRKGGVMGKVGMIGNLELNKMILP